MDELRGSERVLQSVDRVRRQARLATGSEASASSLLEDFGFTGDRLTARLDDLSGGTAPAPAPTPPAEVGTMIVMGLDGKLRASCAAAGPTSSEKSFRPQTLPE
jgi:hypothetical protein